MEELPDDILRIIIDKLPLSSQVNLRHTCKEMVRLIDKPTSHASVKYDLLLAENRILNDWPTYPLGSYIIPASPSKYMLFTLSNFHEHNKWLYVYTDCTHCDSPILHVIAYTRLDIDDWYFRMINGNKTKDQYEMMLITLGLWHVCVQQLDMKHTSIDEFYDIVMEKLGRMGKLYV